MKFRLYYIGAAAGLILTSASQAQVTGQTGYPETRPYGQEAGDGSQPYKAPGRDANGNRIIINGQVIDGSTGNGGRPQGILSNRTGTTLPSGGTLARSGVTAVSIGNSVNISGTIGSTIIINQTNEADQTVNVNGTPESGNE